MKVTWTPEKLDLLKEMAEAGISAQRISIRLQVSSRSAILKAQELGFKLKKPKDVREASGLNRNYAQNR